MWEKKYTATIVNNKVTVRDEENTVIHDISNILDSNEQRLMIDIGQSNPNVEFLISKDNIIVI